MPTVEIDVPTPGNPTQVALTYLDKGGTSDVAYLQRVRSMAAVSGPLLAEAERRYRAMLPMWTRRLAAEIDGPISAILSPPSSRPELVRPYRDELLRKFPTAPDLTDRFQRTGTLRAGEGATVEQLIAATTYTPQHDEPGFDVVLIVDDVLAAGTSAALCLALLRTAGLRVDATLRVAAPLWLASAGRSH